MNLRCHHKRLRNFHKARTTSMVLAVVFAYCTLFSPPLRAQINESILPPMYQTTWNPGIAGGIPADNDPLRPATVWLPPGNPYHGYSVKPALAGVANAAAFTSAFQAAINSAGATATPSHRQIVLLKAGTYFVNPQNIDEGVASCHHRKSADFVNPKNLGDCQVGVYLRSDNVTIRGEGATTTSIVANGHIKGYGTVILFGFRYGSSETDLAVENVTADARKGSTAVTVEDARQYAVGDVITIDHQDGPSALDPGGKAEMNGGYLWFYDSQYFKRQPAFSWGGPGTGAPAMGRVTDMPSANTNARNVGPQWRSTTQMNVITAISGNTLTLQDPLNIDFPLSLNPQVWRTIPLNTASIPVGNRWDGLENIRVAGGNDDEGYPGGCIALSYMAYSWVTGVDADGEYWPSDPTNHPGKLGHNIDLGACYRCMLTGSYAHGSKDENPGGWAYGITVGLGSTQDLVENNISVNNNKPLVMRQTGGGNVIAYNYVDQSELWDSPQWLESGIDDTHNSFTHNDLIEGNWAANIGSDGTHGNTGWDTHLRNYVNGNNSIDPKSANLRAVTMAGYNHYQAFIGNVLHGGTVYRTTPASQRGTPIYQLGFLGGNIGWDDGYAMNHLYTDANWDNVTNGIVWQNGPRTIPNSFYLTSVPAFFKGYTWPWVDPTTGTTYSLPAKARYDSGYPFGRPPEGAFRNSRPDSRSGQQTANRKPG